MDGRIGRSQRVAKVVRRVGGHHRVQFKVQIDMPDRLRFQTQIDIDIDFGKCQFVCRIRGQCVSQPRIVRCTVWSNPGAVGVGRGRRHCLSMLTQAVAPRDRVHRRGCRWLLRTHPHTQKK